MKFVLTILLAITLPFMARTQSQGISLSLQDASLSRAFKLIEQQTDYGFVYSDEAMALAKPVTVNVQHGSLDDVLKLCFDGQPLDYTLDGKMVIVKVVSKPHPAQNTSIDISGKILNEKDEPVAGATISIENSAQATASDGNGEFSLTQIKGNAVLIINSIGYYRKKVNVNNRIYIIARLEEQVGNLEETIIKGYYATSRRLNTGAVSKVTSEDIASQPVSNPLATLQGRVPGLLITQANGLPGSNFSVLIRGQNSIQSGNSPLYIVDGVPFLNDAEVLTQRSGINASSPFNTIVPSDIESIEVLKDADATAIYGSRGANGVILITTKRGKAGKARLDVNIYEGWGRISRKTKFMNTSQYLKMRHEAFENDNETPDVSNAYDLLAWDTSRYTDLQKLLIGNTAHITNATIGFTGGNEFIKFSTGASYFRETTVFPGNNSDNRAAFNMTLSYKSVNNKLSAAISANYANDKSNLIRQDLTQFINMPPDIPPLHDSAGNLNWKENGFSFDNPLANTLRKYNVKTSRLTASMLLTYKLVKDLNVKINLGYNELHTNETDQVPIASQNPDFDPLGSAFFGETENASWIIEPQIEYKKTIKNNSLQFQVGSTLQANSFIQQSINATGYTEDYLLNSTAGAKTIYSQKGSESYKYIAGFGRVGYTLSDRYVLNLTGRRDGSSRFGPGRRFANFWSTGAAWIFSQENFFKQAVPFISFGKLRGSYGVTGNDLIGNYQYLDLYAQTEYPYQDQPSLYPVRLYNPDYSWERIRKLDIGIELGFLKERIMVTSDWFRDKSDNQIIYYSLPSQTGFNSVLKNFPGEVKNEGIELSVNSLNIKEKHFSWNSRFNITISKNKLMKFPGLESSSYAERYVIGKPLNAYIGAVFTGVNPQTGVYEFADKDKNPTSLPSSADYIYTGTTDPSFYGGLQNQLSYKQWKIDFLFEFKKQKGVHSVYNSFNIIGTPVNQPVIVLNRWQKNGDIAPYEQFTQAFGPAGIATFYLYNSSAILTDASYCRLKNLSVSYLIPSAKLQSLKIEKWNLYVEAQNLFVITKYSGADPENQSLYALPPLRRIVCGMEVTF